MAIGGFRVARVTNPSSLMRFGAGGANILAMSDGGPQAMSDGGPQAMSDSEPRQ